MENLTSTTVFTNSLNTLVFTGGLYHQMNLLPAVFDTRKGWAVTKRVPHEHVVTSCFLCGFILFVGMHVRYDSF